MQKMLSDLRTYQHVLLLLMVAGANEVKNTLMQEWV